jgi:triosephosphate isomerase
MHSRTPLIAGNWKMYKTLPEALETANILKGMVSASEPEVMIAPTFVSLAAVSQVIRNSPISLGAQNLHWEKEGPYTGEISAEMLISVGCRYVIVGHSERRQYFGETDETVHRKISTALSAGLAPILCIGETEGEREGNRTKEVLDRQIRIALEGFSDSQVAPLVLAYEPVWAIGTGKTATIGQIQEVHEFLRQWLSKRFHNALANSIRILYGGSVKPQNVADIMALSDVDGALVGGASLKPESFFSIISYRC